MTVFFHEARETIDLLRRVVDKLDETNGCISAEELWDGVLSIPSNVRSSDPTVARHGVRQMEELIDVLQSFMTTLVSTYKSHIFTTRRVLGIPRLTVESLPNEIIHHIVKDALDCAKPLSLDRYSHISRKFRGVILYSPSLWASIPLTLKIPTGFIDTIIDRSAELGLSVDIKLYVATTGPYSGRFFRTDGIRLSPESALSRLSLMFAHQQRWKDLTIDFEEDSETASFLQEKFPLVNLKALRVLRVHEFDRSMGGLLQQWQIAPLEELELDLGMRSRLLCSRMASQTLRVCSLVIYDLRNAQMKKMATFLSAATNLHTLKVIVSPDGDVGNAEFREIRLSSLEDLDIKYDSGSQGFRPAANLLKAILCPALARLSLTARTQAEYSELTGTMRERYPELTTFTLLIVNQHNPDEVFFFDDIIRPLPSTIRKLKVAAESNIVRMVLQASRTSDIGLSKCCTYYENLTHLDLQTCTTLEESFYARLSEILRSIHVSLNYFRPGKRRMRTYNIHVYNQEEKSAIKTLQNAGVLNLMS